MAAIEPAQVANGGLSGIWSVSANIEALIRSCSSIFHPFRSFLVAVYNVWKSNAGLYLMRPWKTLKSRVWGPRRLCPPGIPILVTSSERFKPGGLQFGWTNSQIQAFIDCQDLLFDAIVVPTRRP